jgi:hypothetical protein
MPAPFEILAGPVTVWLAAANTAEPLVDTAPSVAWTKLGIAGSDNYNEEGVGFNSEQTLETFRALGTTGSRKVWRTEEENMVTLTVHDLTVEAFKVALDDNTITTTAAGTGVPGSKSIPLVRGHAVSLYALLLRTEGQSPYADSMNAQIWMPAVYESDNREVVFSKGEAAGLKLTFTALEDATNGFGVYRAQNAVAT